MPKDKSRNAPKRSVTVDSEERSRIAVANRMLEQGKRDFESVYGPKTMGSFDIVDEISAMKGVGIMPKEENKQPTVIAPSEESKGNEEKRPTQDYQAAGFKAPEAATKTEMPKPNKEMPKMPVKNLGPQNEESQAEDGEQETEEEKVLTTEEKCQELNKFVKAITDVDIPVDTMLSWKNVHRDFFMLHLGERVFLFRYLKKQEWIQMKANPQWEQMTEDQRDADIYHRCLLFPTVDTIAEAGDAAGVMSLIAEQVKLQSFFLDEMYVAQMVVKI